MRTRIVALALLALTTAVAFAANVHFINGPTTTVSNNTVRVCGTLAGLGNQDVTVTLSGTATVTCTNKGDNVPPGQTQAVSGSVSNLEVKNGSVTFCVTTNRISNPCPDGMRPAATFSNLVLTVYQGGKVVLQQNIST